MTMVQTSDSPRLSRGARLLGSPFVRILIGIVAVVAPAILTLLLVRAMLDKSVRIVWPQLLAGALTIACYRLFVHRVEKRPIAELSGRNAWSELITGVLGGAGLLAATIGVLIVAGIYRVTGTNTWTVLIAPIADWALVAVVEELVFRGVMFRIIEMKRGRWYALAMTSVIFALSHLPNQGVTVLAVAVTAVAGVMLGAAYMASGRLWLPIGIHFGWNYTLGTVLSVAVSGQVSPGFLQGTLIGRNWLTGGAYGLEASLPGLAAVSVATVILIVLTLKRAPVRAAPGAAVR